MIDHVTANVGDFEQAKRFYEQALAPLGYSAQMEFEGAAGFGTGEGIPDKGRANSPSRDRRARTTGSGTHTRAVRRVGGTSGPGGAPSACRLSARRRHRRFPRPTCCANSTAHSCQNGPTEWAYSPTVKPPQQERSRGRDERTAHSYDDIAAATSDFWHSPSPGLTTSRSSLVQRPEMGRRQTGPSLHAPT